MTTPPEKPNSSSSNKPQEETTSGKPTTNPAQTTPPVAGVDADDVITARERAAEKSDKSRTEIVQERESQELKVIALNIAAHVPYETIDDYMVGAQRVYDWLSE